MSDKSLKRNRTHGKPPPSALSPELKELIPTHPDLSVLDLLINAEDTMAAQVGNTGTIEELTKKAKAGDHKSFFALVKIHTYLHPFDSRENSDLIIPSLSADRVFYGQEWVQKILREGMEDNWFEKDFWKAVFSRQNDTLFQRTTLKQAEFKKHVVNRRNDWNKGLSKKDITFEGIRNELVQYNLIEPEDYQELKSLTRLLNDYGVIGISGRMKKAK
jgi:hypothetical protein